MHNPPKLKAVLIGCGSMGRNQARILAEHEAFKLGAVCDVFPDNARATADAHGVTAYADPGEMLEREKPDTVTITTTNDAHAALTLQAIAAGVRGVYCEKPMAVHPKDARDMVEAARKAGIPLIINHQRRMAPDFVEARRLIESGALGEIQLIRGDCAGDILSDGTHLIDSLLWLAGHPEVKTVAGHLVRDLSFLQRAYQNSPHPPEPGTRFGHVIESGGLGIIEFTSGLRAEIHCGELRDRTRGYHDIEVHGTLGSLWRVNDRLGYNLFIRDAGGGDHVGGFDRGQYRAVPAREGERGIWRTVPVSKAGSRDAMIEAYQRFARCIHEGIDHPMSADKALEGFEILSAIYESARLRKKLTVPISQDRFPLELMIEADAFTQS